MIWSMAWSWLAGSKIARWLACAVLSALALAAVALRFFLAGAAHQRLKDQESSLRTLRDRIKKDDEINALPDGELGRRLARWMRRNP